MTIGARIRETRIELEMSEDDLAQIVGTSRKVIYQYETGFRTPSLGRLKAIADALSITTDFLLA